jgi:Fusaric acid resistance protein-like
MTFMGTQDGIGTRPQRETLGRAVGQGAELAVACLISYALITQILIRVYSVSREDDVLGGMWAVVATVFVYRESYQKSVSAAISRMSATVLSFALCLIYLLFLPFHALGMAALIGIGAVVLILADRSEDVITAAITTTVVMVVAGMAPRHAWTQPILRLLDTNIGMAVGIAAAWASLKLGSQTDRRSPATVRAS